MAAKTNAVRLVEAKNIPFQLYTYEAVDGFLDGASVAGAIGIEQEKVFKTLVLVGSSKENYVCVIPVALELNLKKAAKCFGEKKLEMIPAREITKVTGYIKGGCSPIGMKKLFKTALDQSAEAFDQIVVSAGKVGLQMELPVVSLLELTGGKILDLAE